MNRVLVCVTLALAFTAWRATSGPSSKPAPVAPATVVPSLAKYRSQMTAQERSALADAYAILGRAVAANPADAPVFETTSAVVEAHRAALLFVWEGVLGAQAGKYPGLAQELEGIVSTAIGSADIPLNPAIQQRVAEAFNNISVSLR